MLAVFAATSGFVIQAGVGRPHGVASHLSMAVERKPGEGDPFSGLGVASDNPVTYATSIAGRNMDNGYIEEDDEPWHASCKPSTTAPTAQLLEDALVKEVPYLAAEAALLVAMSEVKTKDDVKKAIDACLKAGGRPGCDAITKAEKAIGDDGSVTPIKMKVTAQGAGWDGMKRQVAKVHDNSVA